MAKREIICGIYKITSPSGKVYIGLSINIHQRWHIYKGLFCKSQPRIFRSLKKYGWGAHIFEIIHVCTEDELSDLEIFYEELYDSTNPKTGLHSLKAGRHGKHTNESKENIRKALKGKPKSEDAVRNNTISNKIAWAKKMAEPDYNSEENKKQRKEVFGKYGKQNGINGAEKARQSNIKTWDEIVKSEEFNTEENKKIRSNRVKKGMNTRKSNPYSYSKEIENRSNSHKKYIINTETGIFYFGAKEAADSIPINRNTLGTMLLGNRINKTSLIYV